MDPRFKRASSPGGSRVARQPGRSSTGTLVYPSAFDPYDRPSHSSINFGSGQRTSGERIIAPRVVPRYRQHSPHKTSSREDYVIRPRRLSLDPKPVPTRRPLSVVVAPTYINQRPNVTSAVEGPSSSLNKTRPRREEDFYIQPASSRAERRPSYPASSIDTGRPGSREHDPRERAEQGGYRRSRRTVYDVSPPLVVKPHDDGNNYGYEYSNRDGPIYRDAPQRRSRRESYSGGRERPISITGLDDYGPRILQPNRDAGPPVTTRGFANLGRSGSLRQSSRARDDEPASREYARDNQDLQSPHKSSQVVSLHQPSDDEYSRARHPKPSNYPERPEVKPRDPHDDDYGRSRQYSESRHRRDTGSRDERDRRRDDSSKVKHDHGGGDPDAASKSNIAGLTDAGDGVRRRHHHHHHHHNYHSGHGRDGGAEIDHVHERATMRPKSESLNVNKEGSGDKDWESHEDREDREERESRERHGPHDRRRRQIEREASREEDYDGDSQQLALPAPPAPSHELRGKSSYDRERSAHENGPGMEEKPKSESLRHRRHHSRTSDKDSYSDDSSSSSSSEESDMEESAISKKERQVRVVSPARESPPPDPPIKGILRPPRPSFPEDPAPVREGVAPPKGAGKKGIPANARWTKIDRRLVNPESLERGKERFEEKPDSVIVLRVLTKEEIQSYAAETARIREERMLTLTSGHESH